ncbi:DUF262 domain-containing protein [uncultured Brevundimonas sp.]|uniref:DUF262 domain-containing protein n=1 Tax=uncultured Brevundimonas sp. TaxID=213418 RepID=UPI0025DF6814|nr:DUF262 domain-containing protein [uncultured Brevundimonas sp.]
MKVKQRLWTIDQLIALKDRINLNPAWQRGAAWKEPRQILLIDSILRGMDVPKIYLRKLPGGGLYDYEAVDGQQRLRAIWNFASAKSQSDKTLGYALKANPPLSAVQGIAIAGETYGSLHKTLRDAFGMFEIGIGEITEATNDEITILFARLQMGMPLNPAELRNADLGAMRHVIQLLAKSHEFFAGTKLKDDRGKHFDFASYAFGIGLGVGVMDLKAPDLRELQKDYNGRSADEIMAVSSKVGDAMNVLAEVDQQTRFPITRKWIFVDLLGLIMAIQVQGKAIDVAKFTEAYDKFEARRRAYVSSMDQLLKARRSDAQPTDSALYAYLDAFKTEGAKAASLLARHKAISRFFRNVEVK